MTLADLFPTFRKSLLPRLPGAPWPVGAELDRDGDLVLGGTSVARIAAEHGTPCSIIDEGEVRMRCAQYRAALPGVEIAYASKALLTRSVARWMREEGFAIDVCSAGELAVAREAGFPGERIVLHGNVKTPADLAAAADAGVGRIVLDSFDEIALLAESAREPQDVLVRVTPDVDPHTHRAVVTGVADQKFGFALAGGMAAEAVRRVFAQPRLRLAGLHCHLGSQLTRVAAYEEATRHLLRFLAAVRDEHGVPLPQLDLGGGHAVPQLPGEDEFDLLGFALRVRTALHDECRRHDLPEPRLTVEPGRALVARAGVTVYRVAAVKHVPGVRTFVAVDGGMSDNPRPALYGTRYTARLIGRPATAEPRPVTVVGRQCEAGDVLATDVPLPADVRPGDLLAVPCTGAYHVPLSSNYNMLGRPPLIAVRDGRVEALLRRETTADLLRRDVGA
ncbi:diaminopimelate decarboxylase [Saccharopolyspora sp. NPDC047091]|uniref:diaminopimelate decarboxylase n=1 Tax=Saccharopolyspora sp. NPDC047091 TaxID=3155924 RepID=UPI0033D02F56